MGEGEQKRWLRCLEVEFSFPRISAFILFIMALKMCLMVNALLKAKNKVSVCYLASFSPDLHDNTGIN